MPYSASENKEWVKTWVEELKPRRVLDIGVGQGTYSDLCRTEEQKWTGIEVFYPYVQDFELEGKYDEIIIADARWVDYGKLQRQDLIIAADFLEHMTKEEAKKLINTLILHGNYLLICFPVQHLDQHDDRNPFEAHIDHWHYEEMATFLSSLHVTIEKTIKGEILAYFLVKGL